MISGGETIQPLTNDDIHNALLTENWYNYVAYSDNGVPGADRWENSHTLGEWQTATGENVDFNNLPEGVTELHNTLEIIYHDVKFVDTTTGLLGVTEVPHGSYLSTPPLTAPLYRIQENEEFGGWWSGLIGNTRDEAMEAALSADVPDVVSRATWSMAPGRNEQNPQGVNFVQRNTNTSPIARFTPLVSTFMEQLGVNEPVVSLLSTTRFMEISQLVENISAEPMIAITGGERFGFTDDEHDTTPVLSPTTLSLNRIPVTAGGGEGGNGNEGGNENGGGNANGNENANVNDNNQSSANNNQNKQTPNRDLPRLGDASTSLVLFGMVAVILAVAVEVKRRKRLVRK